MKTLKVNLFSILVLALLLMTSSSFASGLDKMESKSVPLLVPSNLDFMINYNAESVYEENIEIEDWMLNSAAFLEETIEPELELEEWMFDVDTFFSEDAEEELAVQDWMLDVNSFIGESNFLVLEK